MKPTVVHISNRPPEISEEIELRGIFGQFARILHRKVALSIDPIEDIETALTDAQRNGTQVLAVVIDAPLKMLRPVFPTKGIHCFKA